MEELHRRQAADQDHALVLLFEAARQLGVSRQMLHSILAERSTVSPEMAVRLGRFCGNGASFWLRMQTAYDLWHAERKLRDEILKIPEHAAA